MLRFQPREGPRRGVLRDCENRWIDCSSTVYTGSSREVATVDRWVQQQTETDAGVNTVKMLSPGLPRLHKTVWTLTSGAILSKAYSILLTQAKQTKNGYKWAEPAYGSWLQGGSITPVSARWQYRQWVQCGSNASGCITPRPEHNEAPHTRRVVQHHSSCSQPPGQGPGQEESF